MRWGQARPAQPRGALQISPGEDAHGGLGQHASAPPAPAAGAPRTRGPAPGPAAPPATNHPRCARTAQPSWPPPDPPDAAQPGHNHWHFEQFAAYTLLGQGGKVAVRSQKTGFCISPTDPVDLFLPGAVWQPPAVGFADQCGSPTALWVQEMMPVGWGDTHLQSLAGQAFDITHLPNGTYYVEVVANPEHVLYETETRNDVSLREVILGGTPGHRTVKVPAWHGVDPEN
jgi:hypothetical protein